MPLPQIDSLTGPQQVVTTCWICGTVTHKDVLCSTCDKLRVLAWTDVYSQFNPGQQPS